MLDTWDGGGMASWILRAFAFVGMMMRPACFRADLVGGAPTYESEVRDRDETGCYSSRGRATMSGVREVKSLEARDLTMGCPSTLWWKLLKILRDRGGCECLRGQYRVEVEQASLDIPSTSWT